MRFAMRVFVIWFSSFAALASDSCHPDVDQTKPQFGVGYGSLMEEKSRMRTAPNAGQALPAIVTGFERSFNAAGSRIGFSTTYLGISEKADAEMTAAVYRLFRLEDIVATDARERSYCRVSVPPERIRMLDGSQALEKAQYWVYVNKPDYRNAASARLPLVQSYIDIFLTGCQQLATRAVEFEGDFAVACIKTTQGWSEHWVNDRLYPRRPFIYQPNAGSIDRLLNEHVPEFQLVRIE